MKIAKYLGMTITQSVSFWYSLATFVVLLSATGAKALPPSPGGNMVTGFESKDGVYTGAQMGGSAPPTAAIRVVPLNPNAMPFPNISNELIEEAQDANNPRAAIIQQALQSLLNFGKNPDDYKRPERSGYTAPDSTGSQSYVYRPEPGWEKAPAVNNYFPRTCNKNVQAIPLNPSGVTAESLKGHQCSPYDDRLTCMVCNLYHEARGEPAVGQLAVAQNVMTRVFNGQWPDTVCKVVWEKQQYSWTMPSVVPVSDRKLGYDTSKLQQLIDVAQEGMCLGPNGYTNYYNPDGASPAWGAAGTQCAKTANRIPSEGNHKFCTIGSGKQTRSMDQVRLAEGFTTGVTFTGGRTPATGTTPGTN